MLADKLAELFGARDAHRSLRLRLWFHLDFVCPTLEMLNHIIIEQVLNVVIVSDVGKGFGWTNDCGATAKMPVRGVSASDSVLSPSVPS